MKRPILSIFIPFFLGILIYEYFKININLILLFSILIYLFYTKIGKKSILVFFVIFISMSLTHIRYPEINLGKARDISGEIYYVKESEFGNTYYLTANNINFEFHSKEQFVEGDFVNVKAVVEEVSGENNFKTFNRSKYLKSKNIFYSLDIKNIKKIGHRNRLKYSLRHAISEYYKHNLNSLSYKFVNYMFLGYQGEDQIFTDIKDLGLSHILAVSGLHISILIALLDYLGVYLGFNKKIYSIFLILFLIFYGYIINFPVSIIRALVMYIISTIAIYTNNIRDKLNDLIVAAFLTLLINPFQIYSAGFYLSYLSIFSIVVIHKNIKKIFKKIPDIILISISIQIGMLPLIMYFFNQINLLVIILNIIIVPIISISLTTSIVFLILRFELLEWIINGSFLFVEKIIMLFGAVKENFVIKGASWDITQIILYYIILYCIFNYRLIINRVRRNKKFLLLFTILPIFYIKTIFMPVTIINFIDVGQGDGILLRSKGYNILFDTGGSAFAKEAKGKAYYNYLMKNGVSKIDVAFISHSDIDHVGNLDYIIDKIEIKNLYSNDKLKYNTKKLKVGDELKVGDFRFKVLVANEEADTSNDKSIVLLAEIYGKKILLTGDIEEGEKDINIKDKIDYLKVSHHGSKYSTKEEFLSKHKIDTAVISAGRKNRYGHPHKDVLKRLKRKNIKIYRTDIDGNVELKITPFSDSLIYYKKEYDVFEFIWEIFIGLWKK